MVYKLCRKCKKIISHPAIYCDNCLVIVNKEREKFKAERASRYNKTRDPKYKEFYNSKEWRMLKEKKLLDVQYRCERCEKLATEVHHIEFIQTLKGWERRLDYTNLEALCVDCHNFRHNRFQKRKR